MRAVDVAYADRLGYVVKLLAVAELVDGGPDVSVRVHPAMVPRSHPLASVRGAFNAVFVEGEAAGELMLYGRGAGGAPTASAVLGDLIDAARNLRPGRPAPRPGAALSGYLRPLEELRSAFYLSLDVVDRPGVLAAVATVFGDHGVSIRAMEQVGLGDEARLIFLTHAAREGDVQATIGGPAAAGGGRPGRRRAAGDRADEADPARGRPEGGRGWRGVIEEYREFLPSAPDAPVVTLLEGGHAAGAGPPALRARRGRGLAEGGGGQPDRVVQGPGHDHGHLQGGGGGGQGGGLRLHRQHLGLGRRLRGPGRADLCRADPRGPHRPRASWPRRWSTGPGCCRCGATSTRR